MTYEKKNKNPYEKALIFFFQNIEFLERVNFLYSVHFQLFFKELKEALEILDPSVVDLVTVFEEDDSRNLLQGLHRFELLFVVDIEHCDSCLGLEKIRKMWEIYYRVSLWVLVFDLTRVNLQIR